jgi:hypothetical protein
MNRTAFAIAIASIFAAAASRFPVYDSDLFWHLATGQWMVEHGTLARLDTFSWTINGEPVPQHQWLGQLLLYLAFDLGGWWGVVVLRTLLVLGIATIVLRGALAAAPRAWIGALVAFPALALSRYIWGDRPELVGLLCFVAFVALALAARDGDRRALIALVPLMAIWTNLHGGFVVGVVLLGMLAIEALVTSRGQARAFAAGAMVAILATFLNPDGAGVYAAPGWHFANPPRFIQEWGLPDVTTFPGMLYATTLLGTIATAILARGAPPRYAVLLLPLVFLSLSALRHMPLFALASVPYLARFLPEAIARYGPRLARVDARGVPAVGSLALAAIVLGAGMLTAPVAPQLDGYPVAAAEALEREKGPLLNDYDWGGYLIWSTPSAPVFIDGRLRPYVGSVLDDYRAAIGVRPSWREVLDGRGVALVLVRPTAPLATRLREAGWTALVADEDAVLLRRP